MGGLTLKLESVKETPRGFDLEAGPAWWDEARAVLDDATVTLVRPFGAPLQGYRIGQRLLFRGRLAGAVEMRCGRCTAQFERGFDEPLELLLEPAQDPSEVSPGGIALDPEDLELGSYTGDVLDFGLVFLEIVALAWPMQPRCVDTCRGLCPICGINRNEQTCGCETDKKNRPFAGLAQLLESSGSKSRRS